jgi:hypothetical protein
MGGRRPGIEPESDAIYIRESNPLRGMTHHHAPPIVIFLWTSVQRVAYRLSIFLLRTYTYNFGLAKHHL